MNTFFRVIGEGLAGYGNGAVGVIDGTARGLVRLAYRLAFGMTLLGGILWLLLAMLGAHSWAAAGICFGWNAVLYVAKYLVGQVMAGRFAARPASPAAAPMRQLTYQPTKTLPWAQQ